MLEQHSQSETPTFCASLSASSNVGHPPFALPQELLQESFQFGTPTFCARDSRGRFVISDLNSLLVGVPHWAARKSRENHE